jgi:hypothetical protein
LTNIALFDAASRLKFAGYFASLENSIEEAVIEKSAFLAERSKLVAELAEQKAQVWGQWLKWSEHAQGYPANCLDAGFSEPWSFAEGECAALHSIFVFIQLNERKKADLRTLKLKRTSVSCKQWRAERDNRNATTTLPDCLSRNLESIRTGGFENDIKRIQADIDVLETEIATRTTVINNRCLQIVDLFLQPRLEAAERQRPDRTPASVVECQQSESLNSHDASASPLYEPTVSELIESFRDARHRLEELQECMAKF